MNEHSESVPSEIEHVGAGVVATRPVGLLENVTEVSVGLKPLPVTITVVPSGPEVGLSVIVAVFSSLNVAEAESETDLPVTVTL